MALESGFKDGHIVWAHSHELCHQCAAFHHISLDVALHDLIKWHLYGGRQVLETFLVLAVAHCAIVAVIVLIDVGAFVELIVPLLHHVVVGIKTCWELDVVVGNRLLERENVLLLLAVGPAGRDGQ